MKETYIIKLRDLPSADMKRQVKQFLKDDVVSVRDDVGRSFTVKMRRNGLILTDD
ncbi:MAG: hypothetical protein RTU30_04030 [Candidatus Thorarchaeota archaeon]